MNLALMSTDRPRNPIEDLQVVHSLRGRVRIHLPEWLNAEGLVAWVGRQVGVEGVSVSSWTGNILIYFDPAQTTESELLEKLADYCTAAAKAFPRISSEPTIQSPPVASVVPAPELTETDGRYVTGFRRRVYLAAGWASVGLAVVGAITPGIPTVPFVVVAAYFFVRSSPEAHAWLLRSRWFGSILRNWEEQRAVTVHVKYGAVALILSAMVITLVIGLPTWLLVTIYVFEIIGLAIVLRLKVVARQARIELA